MKKTKDIFDLLDLLEEKNEKIELFFGGDGFLDDEVDIVWGLIAQEYKIDRDNYEDQDKVADILFDFVGGVSKKETKEKLVKLAKKQNGKTI